MAAYNKFLAFTKDLIAGVHNFDKHTYKIMLTNEAPQATYSVKFDLKEITSGNGYPSGGKATTMATWMEDGKAKFRGTNVEFRAFGGVIGPFKHAALYNDTAPQKPVIAWWDYPGESIVLQMAEPFTVRFGEVIGEVIPV